MCRGSKTFETAAIDKKRRKAGLHDSAVSGGPVQPRPAAVHDFRHRAHSTYLCEVNGRRRSQRCSVRSPQQQCVPEELQFIARHSNRPGQVLRCPTISAIHGVEGRRQKGRLHLPQHTQGIRRPVSFQGRITTVPAGLLARRCTSPWQEVTQEAEIHDIRTKSPTFNVYRALKDPKICRGPRVTSV